MGKSSGNRQEKQPDVATKGPDQDMRLLRLLGLAERAGRLRSGNYGVEQAVKRGEARLVLVTEDTSESSKKHCRTMCEYYGVPLRVFSSKVGLGYAIGKEYRSVVAVTEDGFARKMLAMLDGTGDGP